MSGNLAVSTINGVDISVSPVATQAFANSLLAEYTVTGSAVTSIDFSGLDINTHKSYRIEVELTTPSTDTTMYCFVNGDTVLTNYYSQFLGSSSTTVLAARTNSPIIGRSKTIDSFNISVKLVNSNIQILASGASYAGNIADGGLTFNKVTKTATVSNITQLTLTATRALSIGIGSKIRIYRGDV